MKKAAKTWRHNSQAKPGTKRKGKRTPNAYSQAQSVVNFRDSRRISELEVEKIRLLFVAGLNIRQIARTTHHDPTTVPEGANRRPEAL